MWSVGIRYLCVLVLLAGLIGSRDASAQTESDAAASPLSAEPVGVIVVVGSRRAPRSVLESAAPVDVFGSDELRIQAPIDMNDILRTLSPSFNVQRHSIDDEATLVRPFTLRGLPPDSTLVLVNGKRRHRSGVIALLGSSLTTGSQGTDLNAIPAVAMEQVELLRDGASAQYGSDAVAGVINLRLRDAREGASVELRRAAYFEGDGDTWQFAGNAGLPLADNGFFNISLEYRDVAPTVRSATRADAAELALLGYPVADPAQIWGSPEIDDALSTFVNAGIDLGDRAHAYAFGGWAERTTEGGFFFRSPGTSSARSGVFRNGDQRAFADLTPGDGTSDCAGVPPLTADFNAVQSFIRANPNCFLFNERFPGGFTPRFGAEISDWSVTGGVRGEIVDGLRFDVSAGAARSAAAFFLRNTVNASLGPQTPTSFRPRDYIQSEIGVNVDFSYLLGLDFLASPLNIAWGGEWREETFEVGAGDLASYQVGPFAADGFSVGSNGYQGLNPKFAGEWNRPNYAFYVDLEADVTDTLLLGVAARYEDFYDDFGDNIKGKLSALWRVTDRVSLRSTVSTGFRAPTAGQANLQVLSTTLDSAGNLIETGLLPPTNPIAMALGGKELTEEESVSFSAGLVLRLSDEINLTLDYFDIDIENRIALTGNILLTDEISRLVEQQDVFRGVGDLRELKFFANDFDTRTRGLDAVLTWSRDWGGQSNSDVEVAWNWTKTTLEDFSPPRQVTSFPGKPVLDRPVTVSLLTRRRQVEIEDMNPEHRVVITGRHRMGPWSARLRLSYYGDWKACPFGDDSCASSTGVNNPNAFDGGLIADAEVSYEFDRYRLSFGVQNLFDKAPQNLPGETLALGNLHPESTPWDYNGSFWYTRLAANF